MGAGPDPLTAGLPCPACPEQQGQLPEGLWALRKYLSAAQLPRKTGTLNLAQWGWAAWELRCANVHHGVGEGRGAGSAGELLINLLDPMATQASTKSRHRGQGHMAKTSGSGKERVRNCHHTPHRGHGWPWCLAGPQALLGCWEQLQRTGRETQTPGGSTGLPHC